MKFVTIDTETTGLYVHHGHRPFLYIAKKSWEDSILVTYKLDEFVEFMKGTEGIPRVFYNAAFDLDMLQAVGVDLSQDSFCCMVMKHLIDGGDGGNKLINASQKYLPKDQWKKADLVDDWFKANKIPLKERRYDHVPSKIMLEYAKYDVIATEALFKLFMPMIEMHGLYDLLLQEMEFVQTSRAINKRGMHIDVAYFVYLDAKYLELLTEAHDKMIAIAGCRLNLNSPKQIGQMLSKQGFELPKTKNGNYTTKKDIIARIDHPFLNELTRYNQLNTIRDTYIDGIIRADVNGVLYPNLMSTTTVTGRLSCRNPNLQNIPKKDTVIRKGFICRPGYCNFYIDYKQMEYRGFAAYAGETELIRQINEEDADFHTIIMNEFPEYFKGDRAKVKTFNFMLIYGGGINALAEKLAITVASARDLKKTYFSRFQNVDKFFKAVKRTGEECGFVLNKYGRRYSTPKDFWGNLQSYKLINYLVQGSCADYVKDRMNKLEVYLKDKPQRVLLQVHDELIIETPIGEYEWLHGAIEILEDSMEIFGVKLGVDVSVSFNSWADKQDWDLNTMSTKGDSDVGPRTGDTENYIFETEDAEEEWTS